MIISKSISGMVNAQIGKELGSWYIYLSMSNHFEHEGLRGFAAWMKKQADEEMRHAMKFREYLLDRQGTIQLAEIEKPEAKWGSALEIFEASYKHECMISKSIHEIYDAAQKEKDYATTSFLKWFLDEQVEEESNARAIADRLKAIGGDKGLLLMLDKELGERKD